MIAFFLFTLLVHAEDLPWLKQPKIRDAYYGTPGNPDGYPSDEINQLRGDDETTGDGNRVYGFEQTPDGTIINQGRCSSFVKPDPGKWESMADDSVESVLAKLQKAAIQKKKKAPTDSNLVWMKSIELPKGTRFKTQMPKPKYKCKERTLKTEKTKDLKWGVYGEESYQPSPRKATYCDSNRGIQYYETVNKPKDVYGDICEYNSDLVDVAYEVTCKLGDTLRITGAYRTPLRNLSIPGSAPKSQHIHCMALDFQIFKSGAMVTSTEALRKLNEFFKGGIFTHYSGPRAHIHIDLGGSRNDSKYHTK